MQLNCTSTFSWLKSVCAACCCCQTEGVKAEVTVKLLASADLVPFECLDGNSFGTLCCAIDFWGCETGNLAPAGSLLPGAALLMTATSELVAALLVTALSALVVASCQCITNITQ